MCASFESRGVWVGNGGNESHSLTGVKSVEQHELCPAGLVSALTPSTAFTSHAPEVIFTSLDGKTDVEAIVAGVSTTPEERNCLWRGLG